MGLKFADKKGGQDHVSQAAPEWRAPEFALTAGREYCKKKSSKVDLSDNKIQKQKVPSQTGCLKSLYR